MSGAASATLVGTSALMAGFGADAAIAIPATAGLFGSAGAVTAGGLLSAASLGSSAISAIGSIAQSRAASASAGYNAKVAQQNAQLATQNAQFTGAEGEQNVAAAGAKTRAALAATVANQGASGVDINSGSSVNVRESEAKLGTLNALNIRSQAARQAYGFQTQSASDTGQAALLRKQQVSDQVGGYLNAGSTVLGGVGKASQYTNWLNNGGL